MKSVHTPRDFRSLLATTAMIAVMASSGAIAQETPRPVKEGDDSSFSHRILTADLDFPWAMEWGPEGQIWVTERAAKRVTRVDPDTGEKQTLLTIDEIFVGPQHEGLLGMALHPDFLAHTGNNYVYLNYTYNVGDSDDIENRRAKIVRYTYNEQTQMLEEPMELITGIPAWNDHNGGRLIIGADMKLYYSKGEEGGNQGGNLHNEIRAQEVPTQEEVDNEDWNTYVGKILRMNLDGTVPDDNPEIDGVRSHIYTYGHRNPQGIAFGPTGILYESEHGPSSDDEVNIIEAGKNYGWPFIAGFQDDQAYSYINWSAGPDDIRKSDSPPDSVPEYIESEFEPDNQEPIASFWAVEDDFDFSAGCGWICNPTIAPSAIAYYASGEDGIPEWDNSLLIPTLKHGSLYVLPLNESGTEADGEVVRYFTTQNRYRDVLVGPNDKQVFIATDSGGTTSQLYGDNGYTNVLHNPGAIVVYTYEGTSAD